MQIDKYNRVNDIVGDDEAEDDKAQEVLGLRTVDKKSGDEDKKDDPIKIKMEKKKGSKSRPASDADEEITILSPPKEAKEAEPVEVKAEEVQDKAEGSKSEEIVVKPEDTTPARKVKAKETPRFQAKSSRYGIKDAVKDMSIQSSADQKELMEVIKEGHTLL